MRPTTDPRAHEAAPPSLPGAAESLVSFIRLFDGVSVGHAYLARMSMFVPIVKQNGIARLDTT